MIYQASRSRRPLLRQFATELGKLHTEIQPGSLRIPTSTTQLNSANCARISSASLKQKCNPCLNGRTWINLVLSNKDGNPMTYEQIFKRLPKVLAAEAIRIKDEIRRVERFEIMQEAVKQEPAWIRSR